MDINTPFINDPEQRRILEHTMRGELKYTLMNDFLSKYSLQNDLFALKGLLAALLGIRVERITAIEILNPIQPGDVITDKECVLDIKLELNHETIINIELQSRYQSFWPERSLTYLCRSFNHLKEGEPYNCVKPCIHIGIVEHDIFKEDDPRYTGKFYSRYIMHNPETHTEYCSKFEIKVLVLNHLENASPEDKADENGLYHWAKLFKAKSWEELKMIAENNPMMDSFVGTVRKLTEEEKVAQACEARRRYSNDIATYNEMIETQKLEIEKNRKEIENNRKEIEKNRQELDQSRQELDQSRQELDQSRQELDQSRQEIEQKNLEIEELKKKLAELEVNNK